MYQIVRKAARHWLKSPRDHFLLVGTVTYLLILETVGRQIPGPIADVFLSAALVVGCGWLILTHTREPVSWIAGATRGLKGFTRVVQRHTFQIGCDLRRQPAVPRRVPPLLLVCVAVAELLTVGALIWILWQPVSARELLSGASSVGFAATQFLLWCALLLLIFGILFTAPALLRDFYLCGRPGTARHNRRRVHASWFFVLFVTLSIAGMWLLSVSVAMLVLVGSFLAASLSIWLPPRSEFDFIWQPRGRAVVYSMSWRTYVSLLNSVTVLPCVFLLLLAVGPTALGLSVENRETPSVSQSLGILASWISAMGAIVILWPVAFLSITTKFRDPAIPAPTLVRVEGALTRRERRRIRNLLNGRGWAVRFTTSGRSTAEVPVTIETAPSPSTQGTAWPRRVSLDEIGDDGFQWSIARRDQIQRRRQFLRALQSLLKRARRRRYDHSSGLWIAPQYWFILGLSRDTRDRGRGDDQTTLLEVIPPLYHQVFSRPARRHFYEICRAVEVDLIFLEDGVQWRELRRVLRMMFEHYDLHDGGRRIEEIHFSGVPRVRVIIHEFELGAEWERGQYPEPDFDDLARARILHVFRDRGEQESPQETPLDRDHLPSPVPVESLTF